MTLRDADEELHPVPDPLPENWQENLFFILWNPDTLDGFMTHVQRVPGRGVQEARTVVCIGGELASATLEGPFDPHAPVAGLRAHADEPFRRWTLQAEFDASEGPGPHGFIAAHPGGPVPVAADLTLESVLPAADFAAGLADVVRALRRDDAGPQMGDQAHYEQGGTWTGELSIGDRHRATGGLFVRDHSWGIRHEQNAFQAFWTASCLDDGRLFCNAIGIPHGDGVAGIGMVVDEGGVRTTTDVAAEFSPVGGLLSYDRSVVTYGAGVDAVLRSTTQQHWPMYLPYSGRGRYDNNAISRVAMGGREGFGVIEWAATLTAEQTADLDRAALERADAR